MSRAVSSSSVDSPFASVAPKLVANGFSAIPIKPAEKMPGSYSRGEWFVMRDWSRYCNRLPTEFELRLWKAWPDANVGIACGSGLLAFDIDRDDLVEPIKAILPPTIVGKRGRKGETIFYRGDTSVIRSRGFSIDKLGCMDLISDGKQTVIPPSIHRDTGAPYVWTTERTLLDMRLEELPAIDESHVEAVIEVLMRFGYRADDQARFKPAAAGGVGIELQDGASAAAEFFRTLNEDALANLHAWVPRLGLQRLTRQGDHYRSVAEWRPSNSNHPLGKRPLLLSIHPKGIVDYGDRTGTGDGKTYTALDLVMAAFGMAQYKVNDGAAWLGECIGYDFSPKIVLNRKHKVAPPEDAAQVVGEPEDYDTGEGMSEADFAELQALQASARAAPTPSPDPGYDEPRSANVADLPTVVDSKAPKVASSQRGPVLLAPQLVEFEGKLVCGRWEDLPDTSFRILSARFARIASQERDEAAGMLFDALSRVFANLTESPDAVRAYPVEMLGPILGDAAQAIAAKIQVPFEIAAQSVLAAASLGGQGIADVMLPMGQTRPLSLYALTVAQSGDRKSSADNEAMRPVRRREEELRRAHADELRRHGAALAAHRAEFDAIKRRKSPPGTKAAEFEKLGPEPSGPVLPILAIPDATHEGLATSMPNLPPSVGLFSDEGARLLGGHGFTAENKAATAANFSTLWDSGSMRRVRKTTGVTDIRNRRLAIHLMIQPSVAEKVAGDPELRGQGLLARFLVAAPSTLAGTRFWREPTQADEDQIERYSVCILDLLRATDPNDPPPRVLTFDAEARAAWIDFVNEIEGEQADGSRFSSFRDVAGKLPEQAARIAGVLSIVEDRDASVICGDAMLRACELARWYAAEASRIFSKASAAATATGADILLNWLRERKFTEVTNREITRGGPSAVRGKRQREEAVDTLLAAGYLRLLRPNQWQVLDT